MAKRIFVSGTADGHQRAFKEAVLSKLRQAGYEPQAFFESGIPENLPWTFENVDRVMRLCVGAVVIGFTKSMPGPARIAGEYNHYEGAVALTLGLPVLLLREVGVEAQGIVKEAGRFITHFSADEGEEGVKNPDFVRHFDAWLRELGERKDIFLGYCSKSAGIAAQIQLRLERLGASVLNWAMDFGTGGSILGEIEKARAACSCGVFLFSEDDPLESAAGVAAPRDNVVFETGYFMSSKGSERCLIIRHGDAKMPADVGGAIYVHLTKWSDVGSIEGRLRDFITKNL
jgi:Predicted nucleotide-binding protein containing TIR-like domain